MSDLVSEQEKQIIAALKGLVEGMEREQMSLGCVVLRISRPIGTQGKPPEPLVIHVGEVKLKRADIQDFPEARAYALATAEAFLARSLARVRAALSSEGK